MNLLVYCEEILGTDFTTTLMMKYQLNLILKEDYSFSFYLIFS